jgi:site-specific recombinase XerC
VSHSDRVCRTLFEPKKAEISGPLRADGVTAVISSATGRQIFSGGFRGEPANSFSLCLLMRTRRGVSLVQANIRNPNTRRAYARACTTFFAWCDERGLTLTTIRPHDVATYIETRQLTHSAPDVKQQLAAVRMLFDWLITGQIVPVNPAAAVRGPKHVVKTGKTAVLDAKEWRKLIDSIPTDTLRDRRDRALIATLTYSFARINAALKMKVEDLRPKGAGWQVRLHEKGGKHHEMPCHHALAEELRLHRCRWHCRRSQRLSLPHRTRAQRGRAA